MDKYKSVTELAADNPNLAEYLKQIETELERLRRVNGDFLTGPTLDTLCKCSKKIG